MRQYRAPWNREPRNVEEQEDARPDEPEKKVETDSSKYSHLIRHVLRMATSFDKPQMLTLLIDSICQSWLRTLPAKSNSDRKPRRAEANLAIDSKNCQPRLPLK